MFFWNQLPPDNIHCFIYDTFAVPLPLTGLCIEHVAVVIKEEHGSSLHAYGVDRLFGNSDADLIYAEKGKNLGHPAKQREFFVGVTELANSQGKINIPTGQRLIPRAPFPEEPWG